MSHDSAAPAPSANASEFDSETTASKTSASGAGGAPVPRAALVLIGLCFAAIAGAGLLLWSVQGPAVFNEVVLAALAWCL